MRSYHVAQRLAADILHGDVVIAVDLPHLLDLDDVVVVEARDELRLAEEHVEVVALIEVVGEDPFDDEQLLEAGRTALLRKKDLAHAPRSELAQQNVLAEG